MRLYGIVGRRSRATVLLVLANICFLLLLYRGINSPEQDTPRHAPDRGPDHILPRYRHKAHDEDSEEKHFPERGRPFNSNDLKMADSIKAETKYKVEDIGLKKKFPVRVDTIDFGPCDNVKAPPTRPLAHQFHRVESNSSDTFVFSAFFDPRTDPPAVRLLGMASGQDPPNKFCQVWYPQQRQPEVFIAEYHIVPETHDMK